MTTYTRQSTPSEGTFLKWDSGETKTLTVTSEHATQRYQHWVDGKSEECTGEACVHCANGKGRTVRWRLSVLVEGKEEIWEMSNTVFNNLEDVAEMQGALTGLKLKIMRQGTGRQTRYTLLPLGTGDTTPKKETDLAARLSYAKDLCETLDKDLNVTFKEWTEGLGAVFNGKPKNVRVDAFVAWLEARAQDADADAIDTKKQDDDITTMLDNL